jgi:hypothetical protein
VWAVPDEADRPGALAGQDNEAARDLYAAARDISIHHYHQGDVASASPAVPGSEQRAALHAGQDERHRPVVPGRAVRLPLRPGKLAGREELLAELDVLLSPDGDQGQPRVVALCGLGGSGKSSVAAEYAYRALARLTVVWQFAAEEEVPLVAGFADLAAQIGARAFPHGGDPVAQVHGALADWPGEWLLVFDNAPSLEALQKVLPPAGNGRVLITSQNPAWPAGRAVDVPVLSADVAAAFLLNRTGSADRAAALDLASELGGLPLALEQAAAYMTATGRSLTEYLGLFRERRDDLLARGEPGGYGRTVATAWALAFDKLTHEVPGAVSLLRFLACCAPEQIPFRLLLRPRPELAGALPDGLAALLDDPLAADDALAVLRRFSLISPPRDGMVSVHRLVQAVTLAQLPAAQVVAWRQAARSLIEAAVPLDASQPANWAVFAALLPHAEVSLPADGEPMARIADFLGYRGNYAAARDLQQKTVETLERASGSEHPGTLAARAKLAAWVGAAGDPAAARDQFAALIPVLVRVLGAAHPETLFARANLARWTGFAGDKAAARDQFAALVQANQQAFGLEDRRTLFVRANLALQTSAAGNPAAARDQLAELVRTMENVLGAEDTDTLDRKINLAEDTARAGDPAAARDQLAALLPSLERVFGPDYPTTLTARSALAAWTGQAGDAAAARDQLTALMPAIRHILGDEHTDTLTALARLAHWTGATGDMATAHDHYMALLPVLDQVLGPHHPTTTSARADLANWTPEPAADN